MMKIQEIKTKNILTKSNLPGSNFSVNPYLGCAHACKYCYASFMKRFTNHPQAWGEFIDVKFWPEIKNPKKYAGKEIFLSSVTDCYQPCEAKYKRTRAILEQLSGSNIKLSIATKSDLILRDLDLIKTFPEARVSFSINTLDENFRTSMDKAVSISRRLEAMKKFYESGIQTTCFISPIFPGITDPVKIIETAKNFCNLVWLENLNLRGDYRVKILKWIHETHPELDDLYHKIYSRKIKTYWTDLDLLIREYAEQEKMIYIHNNDKIRASFGDKPVIVNYFFHEQIKKSAKI